MVDTPKRLLLFRTGSLRFGIDVDAVQRVVSACLMRPLPGAPDSVRGVVVIAETVIPVIDPLVPFGGVQTGAGTSELRLDSRFILVQAPERLLAVIADQVDGIRSGAELQCMPDESLPGMIPELRGISVASDGMIYVSDPERLISQADEIKLQATIGEIARAEE